MKKMLMLRIKELHDGRWSFDLQPDMNDDDIRRLLNQIQFIEHTLEQQLETEIRQLTESIAELRKKHPRTPASW